MKAWIIQKTSERKGETLIDETTTVYAADKIEATKQGIDLFNTSNITVTQIPDEHGGNVPSDQDIAASWREIIAERGDGVATDEMRSAGGSAYG